VLHQVLCWHILQLLLQKHNFAEIRQALTMLSF
jgi:hypothetical protein